MSSHEARTEVRGDAALALLGLTPQAETDMKSIVGSGTARPTADGRPGDLTETGRRVARARTKSQLTGTALGALVGLGKDQISKIEHGQRRLAPRELPAFAQALGVTIRYLLGADDSPRMALAHRLSQSGEVDSTGESADAPAGAGVPATQRRALELLNVEEVLARQVDLPQPRLSAAGAQVRAFAAADLARRPRNKSEAQRQGRRLADQVRDALDLGSAEIRDLASLIETHFAADVALSPLGKDVDGLCAHTGDQALLVASSDFPDGHVRFTLAHELGHHLLGDPREVIAEGAADMYADDILERRVNSFAAHLLLPEDGVREALAWLHVDRADLCTGNPTTQRALGTLMLRFGVSLQALLFQLADLRVISFDDAAHLKSTLNAGAVANRGRAATLVPGLADMGGSVSWPVVDAVLGPAQGAVRPPQRLLDTALVAARAGVTGTGMVAVLLGRPDDDDLFDAVMADASDGPDGE